MSYGNAPLSSRPYAGLSGRVMLSSDITLPVITTLGKGFKGAVPVSLVMNSFSFAISEYGNYPFNSFTRFNTRFLAANANGIFELDETNRDEETFVIKANIKSGIIDTYNGAINRLRDSHIIYKSDGAIRLSSNADKKATRSYLVPLQINGINTIVKNRRIKFERAIRNRFFDFNIENINGSELELDLLRISTEPVISKRR